MNNNYWYATMKDLDDDDWGSGSYDLDEATATVAKWREDGYDDAYIAVIDNAETVNAFCVDEIHEF